uniref:Uncharacterized protein n=1 Tax=Pithovirus LCDPAC01 TaxID=2506600 RepID=A0A481YN76_9VIRU|nr:MAG: hypothetical protein LCDPAC01_02100 [Pithovirus LCDPAC01]
MYSIVVMAADHIIVRMPTYKFLRQGINELKIPMGGVELVRVNVPLDDLGVGGRITISYYRGVK